MGAVADRLAELGIELPDVPPPAGSYLPALVVGDLVYTSGQLPLSGGTMATTGQVGEGEGLVSPETANELARTCAINAIAAIRSVVGDVERIQRIVKVVGFVSSDPGFTGQPGVINGASDVLAEIFGEAGQHARSAVGVAALPLDASVEVEVIAQIA